MKRLFNSRIAFVLSIIISCFVITSCKPSVDKEKMKAECAKTAIESSEKCKECCNKAGFTGHSWMGGFMTGGDATCECM